jgi:aminoglycoside phosphotransferase family enzyme
MPNDNLPDFISALLKTHQEGSFTDVRLVQTHISFVLLAGEFVYKFKKPVNFGFLDFSTLEKRQHYCEQELLLNRRLCPDIYLDIVTVTREDDSYTLNGSGEVVEYAVKMARMPEEKMMVNLIQAGKLNRVHIDTIVDKLIPFYQQADQTSEIEAYGSAESVAVNVLENFEQTQGFINNGAITQEQFD